MNILITGGASGLGESITRFLGNDPTNRIFFTYKNSLDKANLICKDHPNFKAIKCDFSKEDDVKLICDRIHELDLDAIINNAYAGDFLKTHFHKLDIASFLTDFQINVIPTIQISQSAIALFRKKRKGRIITILTSALIDKPPLGASVYTANKAYLAQLSKSWATEYSKYGITSNTISPSFMQTGMTAQTDERILSQMTNNHPLKKLLTTNEVAEAVQFLLKASQNLNGIDLVINAGQNIK